MSSSWTYTWYDISGQNYFSHDFITGKWAKNGVTEPVCMWRAHYIGRLGDPDFIDMRESYYKTISQTTARQPKSSGVSKPKAGSKIKVSVRRKR